MDRIPRFVYGSGPTTWTLTRPTGRYRHGLQGHGAGYDESAALVPSTWVTTWNHTLIIPLRILETEWDDLRNFLLFALTGATFTMRLNKDDAASEFTVRLVRPRIDEMISTTLEEYLQGEELEIEVRRSDLAPIDYLYISA